MEVQNRYSEPPPPKRQKYLEENFRDISDQSVILWRDGSCRYRWGRVVRVQLLTGSLAGAQSGIDESSNLHEAQHQASCEKPNSGETWLSVAKRQ